jgi:O-antigen biosynthesis protein
MRGGEEAGFGDYYTAHELGDALEVTGADVVYLSLDGRRWRRAARTLDVIVSLLDRFPLLEAPPDALAVAWVRNWSERWLTREWFDEYDHVFATSESSCRLIRERSSTRPRLMPLATNPARFHPVEPDPALAADLAFVGSYWGVEREVQHVLPRVASAGLEVKVFGHGWDAVPGMRELSRGPVPYDALRRVYSSAAVVVDDSGAHARPYGSVNSRVFDALACGALVVTNDAEGVAGLFGNGFPTWSDAASLQAHAEIATGDPARARELVQPLKRLVLAEHTYARRASQLRDATTPAAAGQSNSAARGA